MRLRILKNRGFSRAARKAGLTDQALCAAAAEIESGLIDARLGGFLLKQRIAKGGRGKSGGFRTIVAWREHDRLVFLYLFEKNERENITEAERQALAELGETYLRLTADSLNRLLAEGILTEIMCHDGAHETEPDPR